jgi:hypothetical protein
MLRGQVSAAVLPDHPEKEVGKTLMCMAFALKGPLSRPQDDKTDCDALTGLLAGSLSRFRNPGGHTNRSFQDVLDAMEELILASRLLRIVDERRPVGRLKPTRQPKAVAAGFEGKRNPRDSATGPDRFMPPAMQQGKQPF